VGLVGLLQREPLVDADVELAAHHQVEEVPGTPFQLVPGGDVGAQGHGMGTEGPLQLELVVNGGDGLVDVPLPSRRDQAADHPRVDVSGRSGGDRPSAGPCRAALE
jgi:hypothetical protein